MLEFRNVSKVFGDGTRAADRIDLSIGRGEFCVLLGPSGAGKSTLMGMVNGMVAASSGAVRFDHETIDRRNLKALQRRIGMIHQQLHLVPRLSVLHNVIAGKLHRISTLRTLLKLFNRDDQRRACKLLEEVGLQERHLHRRASELSGGEQQRVAIARAFMHEPEVVLADEPVASLDPTTSHSVLEGLKRASRLHSSTVLCSLHQVEYALAFADRIVAMRKGGVVYDGPAQGVDKVVFEQIYGRESRRSDVATAATDPLLSPAPATA